MKKNNLILALAALIGTSVLATAGAGYALARRYGDTWQNAAWEAWEGRAEAGARRTATRWNTADYANDNEEMDEEARGGWRPAPSAPAWYGYGAVECRLFVQRRGGGSWHATGGAEAFRSGDRLRLQVRPSRSGYLYLVHRGSRGGVVVLPLAGRAAGVRVAAGQWVALPARQALMLDRATGLERFYLVLADRPLANPVRVALYREGRYEEDGRDAFEDGEGGGERGGGEDADEPAPPVAPAPRATPRVPAPGDSVFHSLPGGEPGRGLERFFQTAGGEYYDDGSGRSLGGDEESRPGRRGSAGPAPEAGVRRPARVSVRLIVIRHY